MIGESVALPALSSSGAEGIGDRGVDGFGGAHDTQGPMAENVLYPTARRLLQHCDAVLRLPVASRTADQDVVIARERGIPVYYSLMRCPASKPEFSGMMDVRDAVA
jgi:hypothetical protein